MAGKHVLSEKPVARNIEDAKALIQWYRREINGPSWTVAENWRFLESYKYAAKQMVGLGKIIGFQGRQHDMVPENGKFNRGSQCPAATCKSNLSLSHRMAA